MSTIFFIKKKFTNPNTLFTTAAKKDPNRETYTEMKVPQIKLLDDITTIIKKKEKRLE